MSSGGAKSGKGKKGKGKAAKATADEDEVIYEIKLHDSILCLRLFTHVINS